MNGKGFRSSKLAVAVATSLAVSVAATPDMAYAKVTQATVAGASTDAIIGTGRSKSLSTDAIIGTGKAAKRDAIIGTGADAIIGTGADAIIGTGKQLTLLLGAVDRVDLVNNAITVLNRTLKLPAGHAIPDAAAAGQLMVLVSGKISATGAVEQMQLRFLKADYVAGASKVALSGQVNELDARRGWMKIGGVSIDINAAAGSKTPSVGSVVVVTGTQPMRNGIVLAERIYVR
jgi:hypothetical protein